MDSIISLLTYLQSICIPLYILYRFKESGKNIFVNIHLYPLILSFIYFSIPSFFINDFLLPFSDAYGVLNLKTSSLDSVFYYSQWYTFVFFMFFFLSKDESLIINLSFRPKSLTYKFSKILFVILFFAFILIITLNLSDIIPLLLNRDRSSLLSLYSEIAKNYRFNTLTYISLAVVYVITWRTKKFYSYSLLLLPILLESLTLGRTVSFSILIFSGINYILISEKPRYSFVVIPFIGLIATVFFRFLDLNFDFESIFNIFRLFISDSSLSYLGGVFTYQEFYQKGDIYSILTSSVSGILPSFVSSYILEKPNVIDIYSVTQEYYLKAIGFGLANNLISEAVYYGGSIFLIASPVIISSILYLLNIFKIYRSFPGFLYMLLLISCFRAMFAQSGFYVNFLSFSYLMFSYLIWITYLERKTILVGHKIRNKNYYLDSAG